MSHMVRALRQWPWPVLQKHCCGCAIHHSLSTSPPWFAEKIDSRRLSLATVHSARREVQYESKGLRLPKAPAPANSQEDESVNDDSDVRKSRNQLKREARRAVQWGMDLAAFSTPQIKRILSVMSLEKDIFDAIMLVKRFGNDVREGKRRQFNYIGKLLRDAQPDTELMDVLIQATKAGDHKILQKLCASLDDEVSKYAYEEEEEEGPHVDIATRWLDGLVSKDNNIINEIYSLQTVEFDRQELRRLVRKVQHKIEERKGTIEENEDEVNTAMTNAKKPLACFLCRIAKQLPSHEL